MFSSSIATLIVDASNSPSTTTELTWMEASFADKSGRGRAGQSRDGEGAGEGRLEVPPQVERRSTSLVERVSEGRREFEEGPGFERGISWVEVWEERGLRGIFDEDRE
jgi:hypothetical protein